MLISVVVIQLSNTASFAQAEAWTTYGDDHYGFTIQHPEEWQVTITLSNDRKDPNVIERRLVFGKDSVSVNIDIFPNLQETNLATWFDVYQRQFMPEDAIVQENLSIAGNAAIYALDPGSQDFPPRHATILSHGDFIFRIEYQAVNGGESLEIYRTMLASFQFTSESNGLTELFDLAGITIQPYTPDDTSCCGYNDPSNIYPCDGFGNCTWWARYKRPDTGGTASSPWGDAKYWAGKAEEEGFTVNNTPIAGAIACWPSNHVSYVESYDGTIAAMSDMDASDTACHIDRWNQRTFTGIRFIHPRDNDPPPPTILFSTPAQNQWYKIDQTLSWTITETTGSGVDRYEWWWTDLLTGQDKEHHSVDPPGSPAEVTDSTQLSNAGQGKYALHVKAWNGAGIEGEEYTDWFGYDTIPPTISFGIPAQNQWYNTNKTLSWTVSDSGSGVRDVKWEWDDATPDIPGDGSSGSTTLGEAGQGQHTLSVQAWDQAGNPTLESRGWFGYDTIPPSSPRIWEIACHAGNNWWQNRCLDPSFIWSATDQNGDSGSGVTHYAYAWLPTSHVNPDDWSDWSQEASFDPGPVPGMAGWAHWFLHVKAKDAAGNESSPATFGFAYDGTLPTIITFSINLGAEKTNKTNVRLDLTSEDTGSGVSAVCIGEEADHCSAWRQPTEAPFFWNLPATNHYTHTLYAVVHDQAGNESDVSSDSIYLDIDPPLPHSSNYRICQYVVDLGGSERITSTSYSLVSAIGQPWAASTEVMSSTGFVEQAGFLSTLDGCLPISHTVAPTLPLYVTPTLPISFEVQINQDEGQHFYTNNPLVEVTTLAPNVSQVRLSNSATFSDTNWQSYPLTTTWPISVPTGLGQSSLNSEPYDYGSPVYLYAWFRDEWNNTYGPFFDSILYDPFPPEGQVSILNKQEVTVTLSLEAWDDSSGVVEMAISETLPFGAASWQTYTEIVDWPLTGSDFVHVQFRDRAGNVSPIYDLKLPKEQWIYLPLVVK